MAITTASIKELREATGVGMLDCKKALQATNGDYEKAVVYLREKGLAKAAKRADREAKEGVIELYDHGNGRIGVIVEINCETDFVGRSENFRTFAREIALQIAAAYPKYVTDDQIPEAELEQERQIAYNRAKEEGKPDKIIDRIVDGRLAKFKDEVVLLRQNYIRDESKTIENLLHEKVASFGENVVIRRFKRWEIGESID